MISAQNPAPASSDGEQHITEETRTTSLFTLTRLQALFLRQKISKTSYPPISSIPRTSEERLSAPDASPSPFPDEPIPAASLPSPTYTPPGKPPTVLYLAYGSNLCAQTFLGQRGIRPISQVNVSCPSLDLTFDLPGVPYLEPCFANTAPRKVPKTPPKLPPGLPDPTKPPPDLPDVPNPGKPQLPPPPPPIKWDTTPDPDDQEQEKDNKEIVWDKGLIGVVYEVTKSDFAHIVATEGGGTGYKDILVPCLPLPASVGVPERPPEIPIPFLAHTLYAPQIPDIPDKDHELEPTPSQLEHQRLAGDDDDKPKPSPNPHPKPDLPSIIAHLPPILQNLFLPHSRSKSHPFEPYSQPSERYLSLLITGAFEHDLPQEYQAYLSSLHSYTITTARQKIAKFLTILFFLPTMLPLMLIGQKFLTDPKTGRVPSWYGLVMNFMGNLVWGGYDLFGKPLFGDGERTEEEKEDKKKVFEEERQSLLGENRLLRDW